VCCVGYRGFFEREAAEKFAAGLEHEGLDTYSGGSTAYSTLGYFADPVLSTMIGGGEQYVASLLFHELTHQKLYVKDDSEFSEALATAIEEYGTERWLGSHGTADALALYRSRLRYRSDFADLVAAQQARLRAVFATSGTVEEKRAAKARAYEAMRADYSVMKARWGGTTDYDAWFAAPLNNATLAAVATYRRWVPALRARLEEVGLAAFYQEMTALSKLTVAERAARLQAWLDALSPTGVVPQAG
jgi:predicted aminopeptidase